MKDAAVGAGVFAAGSHAIAAAPDPPAAPAAPAVATAPLTPAVMPLGVTEPTTAAARPAELAAVALAAGEPALATAPAVVPLIAAVAAPGFVAVAPAVPLRVLLFGRADASPPGAADEVVLAAEMSLPAAVSIPAPALPPHALRIDTPGDTTSQGKIRLQVLMRCEAPSVA